MAPLPHYPFKICGFNLAHCPIGLLAAGVMCCVVQPVAGEDAENRISGFQHASATESSIAEVVYKTVPTRELNLTVYRPADWRQTDSRPAIVFFHGGGWSSGSPTQFAHQATHYQELGFVAILAAYRLRNMDGSLTEDSIYDARSALRWLKANAAEHGIAPNLIVAGGGSAGGHLAIGTALFTGMDDAADDLSIDPTPFAIAAWNPVVDTSWPNGFGASTFRNDSTLGSPIHRISSDKPPLILMHGDADTTIPITRARDFGDAYAADGNTIVFQEYSDAAHGFFNNEPFRSSTLTDLDEFLTDLGLLPVPDQVSPHGWVDTGGWLGWINTTNDPYWWIQSMAKWVWAPSETQGWIYIPR